MNLEYKKFADISLSDPFFDSLKADYIEFEDWFKRKADNQAYVFYSEDGTLDGFLYLKEENGEVTDVTPPLPLGRRLKVGTFKINAHGTKLGERFVKKIFDSAISRNCKDLYLTVFPKHKGLIQLIEKYGFVRTGVKTTHNGTEDVYRKILEWNGENTVSNYPLVRLNHKCYILALKPIWHTRLLPDSILRNENQDIVQDLSHTNSIRKVYLTNMRGTDGLRPRDVIVIYRTSPDGNAEYRSVATSVCVVQKVSHISQFHSLNDFIEYCAPFSVFTESELKKFYATKEYPTIIKFTYNIALPKRPNRKALIDEVGCTRDQYWGFFELTKNQLKKLMHLGGVNESLIVD
ncbi:GNAT family N-acetyltransferase [Burkholderia sp. TSV86]|uniref:GNAT family N-acetyltransferase n=1 Tax=Burkholderia sp. TSV86 TaxID=1385594 RepID=UPI0009E9ECF9|nr:GNAT family N-acetyltransferase [Burkholderia sp. TSV86]